jgi:hypothetical protein
MNTVIGKAKLFEDGRIQICIYLTADAAEWLRKYKDKAASIDIRVTPEFCAPAKPSVVVDDHRS